MSRLKLKDIGMVHKWSLENGTIETQQVLRRMVLYSLTDRQREVFKLFPPGAGSITALEVGNILGIPHNHAGNTLRHLMDLGLVEREQVPSNKAIQFVWRRLKPELLPKTTRATFDAEYGGCIEISKNMDNHGVVVEAPIGNLVVRVQSGSVITVEVERTR